MNRRGFLQLLAGAIATAGAGITLAPIADGSTPSIYTRLHARHLWWYDFLNDWVHHRIDVLFRSAEGAQQFGVDLCAPSETLDAKQIAPALVVLNNALAEHGHEVGEIFAYSSNEWQHNLVAQQAWAAHGGSP